MEGPMEGRSSCTTHPKRKIGPAAATSDTRLLPPNETERQEQQPQFFLIWSLKSFQTHQKYVGFFYVVSICLSSW